MFFFSWFYISRCAWLREVHLASECELWVCFLRFCLYFCHVYVYGFKNVSEGACDVQNGAWDSLELEL